MTAPKPGDRVRVVIEGEIQSLIAGGAVAFIGSEYASTQVPLTAGSMPRASVSVEVLPPPEPAWWPPKPGDVIRVWGSTYLRREVDEGETGYNDWVNGAGRSLLDDALLAEIRNPDYGYGYPPPALLVRDGKPVAPTGVVTVTGP